MKKTVCVVALAGLLAAATVSQDDQAADIAQIRDVIGYYFEGHATGEGRHFTRAFHPDASLFWVSDGQLHQRTSADYIAGAPGTPPADEAQRTRRIVNIDISGNAALVKVELDYPGALIYDYMSMLKVEGAWLIINKTFDVQRRSAE